MKDFIQRLLLGRYGCMLETQLADERAENDRLRTENRALLNSLLGTAGFPPIEVAEPPKPQPLPRLRKRSWHQLQAWKEAEAAASEPSSSGTPVYPEPRRA